jgi:hypothetical protein
MMASALSQPLASGGYHHELRIEDVVRISDAISTHHVERAAQAASPNERTARMQFDAASFGVGAVVGGALTGTGKGVLFGGAVGYAAGRNQWRQDDP